MPAASAVKPVVGVEEAYSLSNTAADWNEGALAATAPQNWAEDGTPVPPLAVAPVAAAPALDWAVCIFLLYFIPLFMYFVIICFIFRLKNGMLRQLLVQPIPTGEVVLHLTGLPNNM